MRILSNFNPLLTAILLKTLIAIPLKPNKYREVQTRNYILFYLNGIRQEITGDQAGLMLADFLRYHAHLTGTKIVCAEGDCGACTVLRLLPNPKDANKNMYLPINSCITTVAQMDGSSLVTVEGLTNPVALEKERFTPVQKAMMTCHGSQCGFCTPGFVMALTGLVEKNLQSSPLKAKLEPSETKNSLTGNLCRCTGYKPIIEAAESIDLSQCVSIKKHHYSALQQRELIQSRKVNIEIDSTNFKFFAPVEIKQACRFLLKNKQAKLVAAGTDLGVVHNKRKLRLDQLLSLHLIPELYDIKKTKAKGGDRLSVGARVTLSDLRQDLKKSIPEFARFLDLFASPQIKNLATLVGNVATASPIGDTLPFLLTLDTIVEIEGPKAKKMIPLENFFISYRKTRLLAGEVITRLHFDIPQVNEDIEIYKASQRKDMDISAISLALRLEWSSQQKSEIKTIKIAVGGVAGIPLRLTRTENCLNASKPNSDSLRLALETMHSEITPLSDLRASQAYRHVVTENLLTKFFRERGL